MGIISNNPIEGATTSLPDANVAPVTSSATPVNSIGALAGTTATDPLNESVSPADPLPLSPPANAPAGTVAPGSNGGIGSFLSELPNDLSNFVNSGLGGITNALGLGSPKSTSAAPAGDLRVRLAALNPRDVYAGADRQGIMSILETTGGMIFPYTPQISFSQAVSYADLQLVHSNTDYPAYTRTPSVTISVSGKFTVQSAREGQYAMAAIHFLRTASKSYFGEIDARAGTAGLPPPVLVFSGYGPYMFSNVRVILKSHTWAFDENMDTVSVSILGKTVRLPAMFTLQMELQVVQTPHRMLTKFSFDAFAKGDLLSDGFL